MGNRFVNNRWFTAARKPRLNDSALYCLAHAGGNAEDFLGWQSGLTDDITLKAVVLPGTGRRYDEAYQANIDTLTDNIAAAIEQEDDKQFYLFGHSMGAILAWEVAKKMKKKSPNGLILSACLSPPEIPSPRIKKMAVMSDDIFIKEMVYFNGLDENMIANPFLNEIIAEKLKRDFKLIAGYRYQPTEAIDAPIMAIVGENDAHVSADKMAQWQAHSKNFLGLKQVSGNHFYFNDNPSVITNAINEMVHESRNKSSNYQVLI
ncbi:thioesterase II family protein [Serratia sp. NPDC078593]|uniref:thioesterase II family protein n=1 Tax=unclassified Serratia (in: enterobacteria) TaxID=2647522 RepID=UPI0037D2688F